MIHIRTLIAIAVAGVAAISFPLHALDEGGATKPDSETPFGQIQIFRGTACTDCIHQSRRYTLPSPFFRDIDFLDTDFGRFLGKIEDIGLRLPDNRTASDGHDQYLVRVIETGCKPICSYLWFIDSILQSEQNYPTS